MSISVSIISISLSSMEISIFTRRRSPLVSSRACLSSTLSTTLKTTFSKSSAQFSSLIIPSNSSRGILGDICAYSAKVFFSARTAAAAVLSESSMPRTGSSFTSNWRYSLPGTLFTRFARVRPSTSTLVEPSGVVRSWRTSAITPTS